MATSDKDLYIIEAITNMHAGSGDSNFGIIDKKVQRDVLTEYPVINSSSLKGALREFFTCKKSIIKEDIADYIFGHDKNKDKEEDKEEDKYKKKLVNNQGNYSFFEARLLAIPVRSNKRPYYMAICPQIIKDFEIYLKIFNKPRYDGLENDLETLKESRSKDKVIIFEGNENGVIIEDYEVDSNEKEFDGKINKIFGDNIALFSDEMFKDMIEELPVIARNKLDNGVSENLWYEEIVPRKTKFYFGVDKGEEYKKKFDKHIKSENIQIGANATIGYGYCEINKLGDESE